ncbi:hypothetical protein [Pelagibacterium xiamenense]|uniref:hypothetical protein n=1 Tax=Pelagibacterium xiamenense TaxID=2901140 RepID=UPI001E577043|nr:hypothetical protein [Pelagibacterium xiamenense]MCD7058532.1 hypothetical protein [Pelagibacterium xiamenense]
MNFAPIARLGGAVAVTLGLAACMDVTMDLEVLSETDGRATMTTSVSNDVYTMIEQQADEGGDEFCPDGEVVAGDATTECIVTSEGAFDELDLGDGEDGGPRIEAIGNGQVRVSLPTGELNEEISQGMGEEQDAEMMAMVSAMFEGHYITFNVSGGEIVDTNMDLAEDGMAASYQIPFADLMQGTLELPDELYAVVQK